MILWFVYWLQITWQPQNILLVFRTRISAWKTPVGTGTALGALHFKILLSYKSNVSFLQEKKKHKHKLREYWAHYTMSNVFFNVTVHWGLRHRSGHVRYMGKPAWKLSTSVSELTQNRRRKNFNLIINKCTDLLQHLYPAFAKWWRVCYWFLLHFNTNTNNTRTNISNNGIKWRRTSKRLCRKKKKKVGGGFVCCTSPFW